jgi:aerobic C4-dicarboxylate transport protein
VTPAGAAPDAGPPHAPAAAGPAAPAPRRRSLLRRNLTARVLAAVALGALVGAVWPEVGRALKPLGDVFINLVRMITAPVIFLTVVLGIAGMRDMRRVGRVGGKAFLYFEVVTTVALAIGLVVVNVTRPGAGVDAAALAAAGGGAEAVGRYADGRPRARPRRPPRPRGADERRRRVRPGRRAAGGGVLGAVRRGARAAGPAGAPLVGTFERLAAVFFRLVGIVMAAAPVGAFGAMAYTVGAFGLRTLLPLGRLMADVYLTMAVFVFGVLGLVCRLYGFRLLEFLRYIRDEIVLVVGTSSSEPALPRLLEKLERYGCAPERGRAGGARRLLVQPRRHRIYLSMATLFIAQAYGVDLSLGQQLSVLGVLMVTSKGAAGVTGSGFVVLASTLAALRVVPVEGLALLLGVDRFMSEARAVTNLIGNGVADARGVAQRGGVRRRAPPGGRGRPPRRRPGGGAGRGAGRGARGGPARQFGRGVSSVPASRSMTTV